MRDLRIDTLRGFFLLVVTVSHLPFHFQDPVQKPLGFISTPEGFVFLSGLVAGIVYFPKWIEGKSGEIRERILKRAGQIYLCHGLIFFLLWILVNGQNSSLLQNPLYSHMRADPIGTLISGAALLYQPSLVDILPMYCLFLAVTPAIFSGFEKGKTHWVLGLSAGLYLLAQIPLLQKGLHGTYLSPLPIHLSDFNPLAWQLLFVAGLFFGCRRAQGALTLSSSPSLWLPCLLFFGLCFILSRGFWSLSAPAQQTLYALFRRTDLAPFRLLSFAAFAVLVALAAKHLKNHFSLKQLALLGRHSLSVFTWGTLLILFGWPFFHGLAFQGNFFGQILSVGLLMASLWIPPILKEWHGRRLKRPKALAPTMKAA